MRTFLSRRGLAWWLLLAAAVGACDSSRGADAVAPRSVDSSGRPYEARGLIVKLKSAPSRELAQAAGSAAAGDEGARWARVIEDTQLDNIGLGRTRLRRVGESARLVRFDRSLTAEEASAFGQRLQRHAEVEWVVPNEVEHRLQTVTPNDPYFPPSSQLNGQWWLYPAGGGVSDALQDRRRGVPGVQSAWATQTGAPSAVVAVLDSGVTAHPELTGHVLPGYDFVSEVAYANDGDGRDPDASDPGDWVSQSDQQANSAAFGGCAVENSSWHGTIIAGILAAATNNSSGVAGVSWNGQVLPVRVAGKCGAEVADIIDGMRWAAGLHVDGVPDNVDHKARVVNISFGSSSPCNAAYQQAVNDLRAAGVVVVAAAGNEHSGVFRPASCIGVVAVAALNRDGFKTSYSNFGPEVVISTVGGDDASGAWGNALNDGGLLTIDNDGLTSPGSPIYAYVFGTSFAAPVVAGTISLMLSVNPALSPDQVVAGLRASSRAHVSSNVIGTCSDGNPGRCICTRSTCGEGILDAPQALLFASSPQTYPVPLRVPLNIDSPEVIAAASTGPDLPPNNPVSSGDSGGGGGGALDGLSLTVLLLFAGAASTAGRRRARQGSNS
jgi:serine protease